MTFATIDGATLDAAIGAAPRGVKTKLDSSGRRSAEADMIYQRHAEFEATILAALAEPATRTRAADVDALLDRVTALAAKRPGEWSVWALEVLEAEQLRLKAR